MKRVGANLKTVASIVKMSELETKSIIKEIEQTPFRKFYDEKDGYYFGNIVEAIKYYKIIKNQ